MGIEPAVVAKTIFGVYAWLARGLFGVMNPAEISFRTNLVYGKAEEKPGDSATMMETLGWELRPGRVVAVVCAVWPNFAASLARKRQRTWKGEC